MPRRRSPSPSYLGHTNTDKFATDKVKHKPQKTMEQLGDYAVSGLVNFDANPVEINRKVSVSIRDARLGLLPHVPYMDLQPVHVPTKEPRRAEGGGVHQYTSSKGDRLVTPPYRPFERWPDFYHLGAPAAPVKATYPPAYPAPHARATPNTHSGAPPSVQPSKYYGPPRSHGGFQQRPYLLPDLSQTDTSSESAPAGEKQAIAPSRHYDARARDACFQPYLHPNPRFLDENERESRRAPDAQGNA